MAHQCTIGRRKDENCNSELDRTKPGHRVYFCTTHQQWINVFCSSSTSIFTFADGTVDTFETYLDDNGYCKTRSVSLGA